jgi:glycosyltransferase involved in cell wall biosynthesis
MDMKTVSIVLPCYNEQDNVLPVFEAVSKALDEAKTLREVIFVDDGSSDETWRMIQEASSRGDGIKGIRLSRNFGKEAAITAGLDAAQGDAIVIMDCDFQHPPSLLPELIRLWRDEGADIVDAVKRDRGKESLSYRMSALIFYAFMNRLSGFDLCGTSDFKLLDRKVLESWRMFSESNLFFRGLVSWMGFHSVRVPFDVPEREKGTRHWTFSRLIGLAFTGILAYSYVPLRIITALGALFLLFALVLGVRAVIIKATHQVLDGITLLILINLIVGSVVMISLGIIGEYIARIYREVKGRPRYLVREHINLSI